VASEKFVGLDLGRAVELWTPYLPEPATPDERGNRGLSVVGRLRTNVDLRQAQVEIDALAQRLAQTFPRTNMGTLAAPNSPRPMIVLPHTRMPPAFRPEVGMIGAVIMAATALVLLMACANIASLVLSRATSRSREIAIRLALGAGRPRIVRQLVTESLLLGVAGGGLGLLLSLWTTDVLPSFFPAEQAAMLDARIDARAFAFAALVSVVSSLLFGLAPALHAVRPSAREALRGDSGRISDGKAGRQLRRGLVVAQVGVAIVLLTSAALLVQSVSRAMRADLGFGTRDGVVARMDLPGTDFTPAQRRLYFTAVSERVGTMPGVLAAGLCRALPLAGRERRGFRPEGYAARPGEDRELNFNVVDAAYFSALQLPLLAGRSFGAQDVEGGTRVAIVNDALAARYFGGAAIGKHLTDSSGTRLEIIGVVRTARHRSVQEAPTPIVYYPLSQTDATHISVIVRTSGDPSALVEPVRQVIRAIDRGVPVFATTTLSSHLSEAIAADRLTASLVAVCGGMALLLALIGVYGVIAYSVVRRAREIGVRVALGARPRHVVRLVLTEGLRVTLVGIALGLAGSWAAGRQLDSMLYGVNASDPLTYVLVAAAFAVVSTAAGLGPTARALAVQPVSVLRQE
jgi:putative ABC transport system permease protein